MVHGPPGCRARCEHVLKRVEDLEREIPPIGCCGHWFYPSIWLRPSWGWTLWKGKGRWVLLCFVSGRATYSGPEILRNKVHTGWVWKNLLWKNLRNILIQKIHHKSTLQISGPKIKAQKIRGTFRSVFREKIREKKKKNIFS